MNTLKNRFAIIVGTAALGAMAACSADRDSREAATAATDTAAKTSGDTAPKPPAKAAFRIPSESEITDSATLVSIRRGRALIHSTRDSLPQNVRANLTCANCHVDDGTKKNAMPLVGAYARFPQYRARSGRIDLIENRINDCFERSMNGRALDRNGQDMRDMVAYLAFLSRGFPVGIDMDGQSVPAIDPLPGDTIRGKNVYGSRCIACHGVDGGGTVAAPPLWGPKSYNIGAGMARVNSAARFIHQVMPRDRPGSLTPQEAFDVATYVNSRPRPDFVGKEKDWPKGGAPKDVAYKTLSAEQKKQ